VTTPPHPKGRIGFFGCSKQGEARVVRCAPKGEKPVSTAMVKCPVCGTKHTVNIMWRPVGEEDKGRKPELLVGAA
jgi:hypothetical protein